MSKEAMKLALEALNGLNNENSYWWQEVDEQTIRKIEPAIKALEEALAKQEQGEPVAYRFRVNGHFSYKAYDVAGLVCEPLYTTPQQRKPLTDEQILKVQRDVLDKGVTFNNLVRVIEAAHGIKE